MDCGSDHQLLIVKFRFKLKKVGKTTRPFRYDLNQIPYDYTVEVRNRFKGLDLIDKRVPDEPRTDVCDIVQETGSKTIPKKKKHKKAKWLAKEALQIAVKRREAKSREGKIFPSECRVPKKKARRDKKASSVINAKKWKKIREWERLEISSRKLGLGLENQRYQGNISCKDQLSKGQKWYGPNRSRRY